jgi:prepilin-type N-terminal cleavage/methylation domain-containing protein
MFVTTRRRADHGFTLLELLVIMAILGFLAFMGYPALINTIHRARVDSGLRHVAMQLRVARMEAIKRSTPVYVDADVDAQTITTYRETTGTGFSDTDDTQLSQLTLPLPLVFGAVDDVKIADLPDSYFVFQTNGSVQEVGAYRLADDRGNFFEIRVDPRPAAKVTILKWEDPNWRPAGEGEPWQWQ